MRWGLGSYAVAWNIGVRGYDKPQEPLDIRRFIDLAGDHNVALVQICDNLPLHELSPAQLQEVASHAAGRGIEIEIGCRSYEASVLARYGEIAELLGSPIVRTLLDGPAAGTDALMHVALEQLSRVLPHYAQSGIAIAIENYEGYTCADLVSLIGTLASPSVGVCLDTVNSMGALEPLPEVVALLAPHTLTFHLKDFMIVRHRHTMGLEILGAPAGEGRLDVASVLSAVAAHHPEASVILELWPPFDGDAESTATLERDWLARGVAYLRTLFEGSER
jgi:sugar phosphate isomerase/epimerase